MSRKPEKTRFPGVYFKNNNKGDITYYVFHREGEKQLCRRIGKKSEGWTLAKVKDFRIDLMADARKAVSPPDLIIPTPKIIQKAVTIGELVDLYFKRKIVDKCYLNKYFLEM